MSQRLRNMLPLVILIAAVLVLFYRLLLGEVIFWGTPLLQFYPWQKMAFDMLRMGQLPLWNPLVGHGAPLLANYQTAVFYPPNWLNLIVPTEYAMGIIGVLHLIWAGLGMITYLRWLGVDRLGQGIGALAFALSGYLIGRFGFLSITNTVSWLPWLIWSIDRLQSDLLLIKPNRIVVVATIIAMMLLAGHAQSAFYMLTLAGFYTLWHILNDHQRTPRQRGLILFITLLSVLLGVAIASVQLFPTLELMSNSQRSSGLGADPALTYSFWPWRFLTLLTPNLFGSPANGDYWGYANYWEDAVYVGLITMILGGRAIMRWRLSQQDHLLSYNSIVPFYGVVVIVSFFLALGKNNPVFVWMFDHIPGLNLFQGPTRWTILAVFALATLAGIGANQWKTTVRGQAGSRRALVAGAAIVIGAGIAGSLLGDAIDHTLIQGMLRFGIILMFAATLPLFLHRAERTPNLRLYWEIVVLGFLAVDLVIAHWGLNPAISPAIYRQQSDLVRGISPALEQSRIAYTPASESDAKFDKFYSFKDLQAEDSNHWAIVRSSLLPNLNMMDGIPSASNFDPLLVGSHSTLMQLLDEVPTSERIEMLRRMNVGILLTTHLEPDLALLGEDGPVYAYEIPDPWPRALIAQCQPEGQLLICEPSIGGTATIVRSNPNWVEVEVSSPESANLLLIDTYYPGWVALVDGKLTLIRQANGTFRAVQIPKGIHTVRFVYHPNSVRLGIIVSIGAILILAGLTLMTYRLRSPATKMRSIGIG